MIKKNFREVVKNPTLAIQDLRGIYRKASGDEIIEAALLEINARFARGTEITSPKATYDFLKLQLAHLEHEAFAALWLDNRHRVDQCSPIRRVLGIKRTTSAFRKLTIDFPVTIAF